MSKKVDESLVETRIKMSSSMIWEDWRRWLHGLRRITLGDYSELGLMERQEVPATNDDDARPVNSKISHLNPVQLRDAAEGKSNHMIRAIGNIVMSLVNNAPKVEFEGIDGQEALFHRLLIERELGPKPWGCDFVESARVAVYDACFCIGWMTIIFDKTQPAITRLDPLDVVWDQSGATPAHAQWVKFNATERASHWKQAFKSDAFDSYLSEGTDPPVSVSFYYDVSDPTYGIYRAYVLEGGDRGTPVKVDGAEGDNYPFLYTNEIAGVNVSMAYLPTTPLYFAMVPGTYFPDSIAYRMVSHQRANLEANGRLLKMVRMGPKRVINLASLDSVTRDSILQGGDPDLYYLSEDELSKIENVTRIEPGVPVDNTLMEYRNEAERMITAMSGEDPFTSGANNDKSYTLATNVAAVQSASRLTVDYRSEIVANCMAQVIQKFLWALREYGDKPTRLQYEDVVLEFDEADRVGQYINPDARVVVRKDTLKYMDQATRIARAGDLMSTSMNIGHPTMMESALDEYLNAQGVTDPDSWLEMPQTGDSAAPTI